MTGHLPRDTAVLLGRSLRHVVRSPDTIITTAVTPITEERGGTGWTDIRPVDPPGCR